MDTKSDMYNRLERLYQDGELTESGLNNAVIKKWITEDEKILIINSEKETNNGYESKIN